MCLQYKSLFDQYVGKGPKPLSCYHFSAVFAWKDFFEFVFEVIEEQLCVFARSITVPKNEDRFLYLPPLGGEIKMSTIKACFGRMTHSRVARVENIFDNQLQALKAADYNTYLKAREYLYRRDDLAQLAGHAYKSQRHDVHVFEKACARATYRPYVPSDLQGCVDLFYAWAKDRKAKHDDPVYVAMLEDNATVHPLLMGHTEDLGLVGRVIEIDGKIAAYTFGYGLDEKTFCVLLEVADLKYKGIAAYVFQRLCADEAVKGFDLINTMDDFGLPQVVATKKAYHPCQILPVYNLKKL